MSDTIEYIKGDTLDIPMTFTENDLPMNLTGYHVFFTVKKQLSDSDANAKIKLECSIADAVNGLVNIPFISDPTQNMEPGAYFYDIRLKYGSVVMSALYGTFRLYDNTLDTLP
jgi:hypothetical protein